MQSIGIDLGATQSHVFICSDDGSGLAQTVRTPELGRWLKKQPISRVVMESCTQSRAVALLAKQAQHDTVIVPAHFVRSLGVGRRGIKTDKKDAEVLALAGHRSPDLPSVHLRTETAEARRELVSARALLIAHRTAVVLHLKSVMRGRLTQLKGRLNPAQFVAQMREALMQDPRGIAAAQVAMLQSFEALNAQIKLLDEEVKTIANQDASCQRAMTVPGVGPLIAVAFVAHLDDPHRFASADAVASYLALVPGEMTTGGKIKRTGTIHCGPTHLKTLLVQAAWSMWRSRPEHAAVLWARTIAARRGKRIAIVALARKIGTIMWAMLKHECDYKATRGARELTAAERDALPVVAASRRGDVRKADEM